MQIEQDLKLDFKDVLIRPKRSTLTSRSKVTIKRQFQFMHSGQTWSGVPIIAANMDTIGTFRMAEALSSHSIMTALHKHHDVEDLKTFFLQKWYEWASVQPNENPWSSNFWYTMGTTETNLEKFKSFSRFGGTGPDPYQLCIDVANGYQEGFVDFVKRIRHDHPRLTIMAGNVATGEMVQALILAGADVVKIGIGPGSVCTTRRMTGVGYPQLSAIIECADAAHGTKIEGREGNGLICADGGCTVPGDIVKAFAANADFVMLGGMLAGHDECEGEITNKVRKARPYEIVDLDLGLGIGTRRYYRVVDTDIIVLAGAVEPGYGKMSAAGGFPRLPPSFYEEVPSEESTMKFYGMSSKEAMTKHSGGVAEYRAAEGKVVEVPYRGPVENTVQEILGGLRSACSYVGAVRLKDLSLCTTFVRVSRQMNEVFS